MRSVSVTNTQKAESLNPTVTPTGIPYTYTVQNGLRVYTVRVDSTTQEGYCNCDSFVLGVHCCYHVAAGVKYRDSHQLVTV